MTAPTDFVWDHLLKRAQRLLELSQSEIPLGFFEYMNELVTDVVAAVPGSGKTRAASRLANHLWQDWKLSTLHIMLSHQIIEERLVRMAGEADDWAHWRRHDDNCERRRFNTFGYVGYGECQCDRGQRNASRPTLAPRTSDRSTGQGCHRHRHSVPGYLDAGSLTRAAGTRPSRGV